ncbi:MAG: hypothetical protein ACR2PZ_27875 [Pseudomonadales bacterium]
MEFVLFLAAVLLVSVASFWLMGSMYGLIHRPSVYFPPTLAMKMSLGAIFGSFVLGVGGVVLAAYLMNYEFKKRPDYRAGSCILVSVIISVVGSAATLFAVYGLSWQILG